ncbi:hypothetical protein A3H26_01035 [candidate division WWE3 bacterium RIFCSPLOWO2_12_FULL_36_10]|uniref:Uncharacterized protein n=1 Tax=candidate division WWE3 bacterium RIFCSPLOWO2_12_FULL_36_10 TaxID=1802630 RepID=A0A1F4VGZ8_UNCKA|nr:MAG: hypothetical protein A3H26_01035 [candidate division WWE3 bacterium RIFCSPLOWO2_12_FULL_36_10]
MPKNAGLEEEPIDSEKTKEDKPVGENKSQYYNRFPKGPGDPFTTDGSVKKESPNVPEDFG